MVDVAGYSAAQNNFEQKLQKSGFLAVRQSRLLKIVLDGVQRWVLIEPLALGRVLDLEGVFNALVCNCRKLLWLESALMSSVATRVLR